VNLTLFQKALALVALPVVLLGGAVVAAARFLEDHLEAARAASHTKEVIAEGYEVQTLLFDAHATVRGAVIIGDPAVAVLYGDTRRELDERFAALEELVGDNPDQGRRVRAVRAAAAAVTAYLDALDRFVRAGAADRAMAEIRTRRGERLVADFRREANAFLAEEQRLDRVRAEALDRSRGHLVTLLVVGGVVGLGCTVGVGLGFRRTIARRFAALEANAVRLAAGEPALPLPGGGVDEITRIDLACRKLAADLTDASARFRDLYDNAPCGYHSVDPDGTLVAVNRTEARWLGYTPDELLGRVRFAEFVRPADRDAYLQGFARVREEGGVAGVELELVRRDGTTFPVLIHSSTVRAADGGYLRSRTTLTDITDRKRAEDAARQLNADLRHRLDELARTGEALRASEERFRLLVESAQDYAILMLDPAGRVASWSPGAAQIKGYAADEILGRHFSVFYPPEAVERGWPDRELQAAAATGRFEDEGWRVRKDGSRFWTNVVVTPVRDGAGKLLGYSKVSRDLTERKRIEDEVRRLNGELEERVRVRTADLEAANRDLAQKNAENEMFVYSVSHDLRSPLVNLQGFSKELEKAGRGVADLLADDGVPPALRARAQELLERKMVKAIGFIQTAVMRLSGIIDALLRLSRAGRVEYRWEAVDVAGVVGRVVAAAHGTVTERGAAVRVDDLPPAWGDRTAVEQVFGNLVGNALAYLDPARPGEVEVGVAPGDPAGGTTYFVRDNGLGIAEGHQARIFQAFQRAHPGVGSGEGLGLAIVARVVERHHGRVWVESRPGAGSTFFVALPTPPRR
jgi:PAS domain S-box-containing protein